MNYVVDDPWQNKVRNFTEVSFTWVINTWGLNDAYMRQWTGSAFVHLLSYRLFGAKQLPELIIWTPTNKQVSMKYTLKQNDCLQYNAFKHCICILEHQASLLRIVVLFLSWQMLLRKCFKACADRISWSWDGVRKAPYINSPLGKLILQYMYVIYVSFICDGCPHRKTLCWHWEKFWEQNGTVVILTHFNTLRPRQNVRHFPDDIFQSIF